MGTIKAAARVGKAGLNMLSGNVKYKVIQDAFNIDGDYHIADDKGVDQFIVDSALLRLRESLVFKDMEDNELCSLKEPLLSRAGEIDIKDVEGDVVATARRSKGDPPEYSVKYREGPDITVDGDVPGFDYKIKADDELVATVNKNKRETGDEYDVEVAHGDDDVLVLATVVALDVLSTEHEGIVKSVTATVSDTVQAGVSKVKKRGTTAVAKAAAKGVTKSVTKKD